jgi:hypothetical protein
MNDSNDDYVEWSEEDDKLDKDFKKKAIEVFNSELEHKKKQQEKDELYGNIEDKFINPKLSFLQRIYYSLNYCIPSIHIILWIITLLVVSNKIDKILERIKP